MINYKTAKKDELIEEMKRLSKVVYDRPFGTKKEFLYLPEILSENERPSAVVSGSMDGKTWLIVLTNQRVIFLDKGMFGGLSQVDVRLSDIASISCKTGFITGSITVSTVATSYTISNVVSTAATPFTNLVNAARMDSQAQPDGATTANTKIDQLERLAALKEKGVLSDDEFASEKAKILAM